MQSLAFADFLSGWIACGYPSRKPPHPAPHRQSAAASRAFRHAHLFLPGRVAVADHRRRLRWAQSGGIEAPRCGQLLYGQLLVDHLSLEQADRHRPRGFWVIVFVVDAIAAITAVVLTATVTQANPHHLCNDDRAKV